MIGFVDWISNSLSFGKRIIIMSVLTFMDFGGLVVVTLTIVCSPPDATLLHKDLVEFLGNFFNVAFHQDLFGVMLLVDASRDIFFVIFTFPVGNPQTGDNTQNCHENHVQSSNKC
jgi:hypothetical protein